MILVDTSAWVEFDRATGSAVDLRLTELVSLGGGAIACTEPVLMEVLAGSRDGRRHGELRQLLTSYQWIACDPVADFEGASIVYRRCREVGITPRGLIDCMIVNIALRSGSSILAFDRDIELMSSVLHFELDPASSVS
jgi:predicted nucleic acid-binding protein